MSQAEGSIIKSLFGLRDALSTIIPDFSGTRLAKDGWFVDAYGKPVWKYNKTGTSLVLAEPLTAADFGRVLPKYKDLPDAKKLAEVCTLFTRTSKMNCYSWNLPAGPPSVGGTCPGARFGFELDPEDPEAAIRAASESATDASQQAWLPKSGTESVRRFICNGCYALKNNYICPSVVASQLLKQAWLTGYAMVPDDEKKLPFVDAMVRGIESLQVSSGKRPVPKELAKRAEWTHPDFFRIHDSGDFFSEAYLLAWLQICRRLPDVHFWAPTRIWSDRKMFPILRRVIDKGLPSNLALRPSGLFFKGPQPSIRGLSAGSSSTHFSYLDTRKGVQVDIERAGDKAWGCPAYLPSSMGGGAVPLEKKVKENPRLLRRMPVLKDADDPLGVYYPAVVDSSGQYVANPESGRPLSVAKAGDYVFDADWRIVGQRPKGQKKQKIPEENIHAAQLFQPAGCCSIALDPLGAEECRVCWGISAMRRNKGVKHLPVIYAEH
jgi:hypothetical protein